MDTNAKEKSLTQIHEERTAMISAMKPLTDRELGAVEQEATSGFVYGGTYDIDRHQKVLRMVRTIDCQRQQLQFSEHDNNVLRQKLEDADREIQALRSGKEAL